MPQLTVSLTAILLALTAALPTSSGAPDVPAPRWSWPVPAPHPLLRPFIAPATEFGAGHRGIDIAASDRVLQSPADGRVHFAGMVAGRGVLSIDHGGGYLSSFEPVTTKLNKGDAVSRGDEIGQIKAGHCEVPCVHFGVRLDGEYVSPLLLVDEVPRAVLLPLRAS